MIFDRLVPTLLALFIALLSPSLRAEAAPSTPQKGKPGASAAPGTAAHASPKHTSSSSSSSSSSAKPAGKAPVKENKELTAAYKTYVDGIRPKIYQTWYEKLPFGKYHVTLTVTISPEGSANDMQLSSSPKNSEAEQAASEAFNSAQPLSPLPAGSPACKLVINMDVTASPPAEIKSNFAMKMDPVGGTYTPAAPVSAPEPQEAKADEAKADDSKDEKK